MTERRRDLAPKSWALPVQDLEQTLQVPQLDTWQSFGQGFDDSLFDGGDEIAGDISAYHRAAEFEPFTPGPGGYPQENFTELTATSGLLFVAIMSFGIPSDRLTIGYPRCFSCDLRIEALLQTLKNSAQMQLSLGEQQ